MEGWFFVEYEKEKKDEELSYHMDESEITLNVCLGKKFTGGGLFFPRYTRDYK